MTRWRGLACLALLALGTPFAPGARSASPESPPATPVEMTRETFFGSTVEDPYRWIEDLSSPRTREWFRLQNDYARGVLDALPERSALRARIAELNAVDIRVLDVQFGGDDLFYLRRGPADQVFKLYVRHGITGPERLLVDPATFAPNDPAAAIDYFRPSPNGKRLAFGVSAGGSENASLHVLDVPTGKPAGPPIPRARDGSPSWRFDSAVLFYHQLKELPPDAAPSEMFRDSRAWARTFLADGGVEDVPVLGRSLSPAVELAPDDAPAVVVSPVSPWAIGVVQHGVERELTLYVAPLAQVRGPATPWRKLAGPERAITAFDLRGEWIYLVTHEDAPRYKVVRVSLNERRPYDPADAEMVVPESERVVTGLGVAKDALYVQQSLAGVGHLLRLEFNVNLRKEPAARTSAGGSARAPAAATPRSGPKSTARPNRGATAKAGTAASPPPRSTGSRDRAPAALPKIAGIARGRALALPFAGAIQERVTDPLRTGALLRLAGWTESPGYYAVDGKSGAITRTALMPPSAANFSRMTSTDVRVRSHDGVEVPLTIVHARDAVRDGSAPLLLDAYGAYGETLEPTFWPSLLAWLERGGVYAVAHVRGGGEFGKPWHLAGRRETKPNTWKDMVAAGEWLVRERWTGPGRLGGIGASAGGLAVGNAIIERPTLFAAVVSMAGFHDTLRSEVGAAGPANATEFGSVSDEAGFRSLLAMSPYARVQDGVSYPAALFTTGFNDNRVDPWDPGKMAARLQAANASPGGSRKPVLLRVDFDAGHGITSTREQAIDLTTDAFAFLRWQLAQPAGR